MAEANHDVPPKRGASPRTLLVIGIALVVIGAVAWWQPSPRAKSALSAVEPKSSTAVSAPNSAVAASPTPEPSTPVPHVRQLGSALPNAAPQLSTQSPAAPRPEGGFGTMRGGKQMLGDRMRGELHWHGGPQR